MKKGAAEFTLKATSTTGVTYEPRYQYDEERDRYYLNVIQASIVSEHGELIAQNFGLYRQRGFDATEMENLLNGRAVYKNTPGNEGNRIGRWTWLDFSEKNDQGNYVQRKLYDSSTNFRLIKELSGLNLGLMTQDAKEDLIRDLQKGARVGVNMNIKGAREKVYLEANPKRERIMVTNVQGQEINLKAEKAKFQVVKEELKVNPTASQLLENKEEAKASQGQKKKIS